MKIKIKPLSVNKAWQGKRFKTREYKSYEELLLYLFPTLRKGMCLLYHNLRADVVYQ